MTASNEVSQRGATPSGKKRGIVRTTRGLPLSGDSAERESEMRVEDPGEVPAVGHVLRRAREYRDLSLREVERRIGRSNAYLSQVERGLIRRPDPVLLLELADLYRLDFMTLAAWAGWSESPGTSSDRDHGARSLGHVLRLALQLDESQRNQVMAYIQRLLQEGRS
jgi:transcriptional regulator with XRE-family HTH domain